MFYAREAKIKRLDKSVIIAILMYAILTARILFFVQNVKIKSLLFDYYTLLLSLFQHYLCILRLLHIFSTPFLMLFILLLALCLLLLRGVRTLHVLTRALGPRLGERLPLV